MVKFVLTILCEPSLNSVVLSNESILTLNLNPFLSPQYSSVVHIERFNDFVHMFCKISPYNNLICYINIINITTSYNSTGFEVPVIFENLSYLCFFEYFDTDG